ncbi:hypothetical protein B0O99DRAFT_708632 [Bisporella sp. PMI_857]|nr:hypothetical protein B0O99DRAFT_708632 [Bisporella sp. PMI_857]
MSLPYFPNLSLIYFGPKPCRKPTESSSRILILGAGVAGLTTAWLLLDRGYKVTILAKAFGSADSQEPLASKVADVIWNLQPMAHERPMQLASLTRDQKWSIVTCRMWWYIADDAEMSAQSVNELGISPKYGTRDAYEFSAPTIDTNHCINWLTTMVQQKGAEFVTESVSGELFLYEPILLALHKADVIINTTGYGSLELAADPACYPVRGAFLRIHNNGTIFPPVTSAITMERNRSSVITLIPCNNETLMVGSIARANEPQAFNIDSPQVLNLMAQAKELLPCLEGANVDPTDPLVQGAYTVRSYGVRVERDAGEGSKTVHNYGHGNLGWTMSWGCAETAVNIVGAMIAEMKERPKPSVQKFLNLMM